MQGLAPRWRRWVLITLVVLNGLALLLSRQGPRGQVHLWIFPRGDGLLVMTSRGRLMLLDGGMDAVYTRALLGQTIPFWQRTLDLVVLSEARATAVAAQAAVLAVYPAHTGWYPEDTERFPALEAWRGRVQVPVPWTVGRVWDARDMRVRVLGTAPFQLEVQIGRFRLIYAPHTSETVVLPPATLWVVGVLPSGNPPPLPPLVVTRQAWPPGKTAIPHQILAAPRTRFFMAPEQGLHIVTDGQRYCWEIWP